MTGLESLFGKTLWRYWRLGRAWRRLPRSARMRVLRRALREVAAPDRWVALVALGWAHRELLSSPWGVTSAAVLASGAAGLVTLAIRWIVRRRRAPKVGRLPLSGGGQRARRRSILDLRHASPMSGHNELICWELGEQR
jgi:hypothetical protein